MDQKGLQIPGIRKGRESSSFPMLHRMLEGIILGKYMPGNSVTIMPSEFRFVVDGLPAPILPQGPHRMSRNPRLKAVELPEGHFFRLITNAELISGFALATACAKKGFGSSESRQMVRSYNLKYAADCLSFGMPVLYTEMEFEKAEPATIVWGRLDSALTATTDESSRVIRPHNVKTFLGAVGLEITEIVLMGLAINSSCLTKPVDVNLAHNRLLLPEIDNSENFSFIINETVKVEDIRILPESDLIAIDKYLVAGIKSRIEETAGS